MPLNHTVADADELWIAAPTHRAFFAFIIIDISLLLVTSGGLCCRDSRAGSRGHLRFDVVAS